MNNKNKADLICQSSWDREHDIYHIKIFSMDNDGSRNYHVDLGISPNIVKQLGYLVRMAENRIIHENWQRSTNGSLDKFVEDIKYMEDKLEKVALREFGKNYQSGIKKSFYQTILDKKKNIGKQIAENSLNMARKGYNLLAEYKEKDKNFDHYSYLEFDNPSTFNGNVEFSKMSIYNKQHSFSWALKQIRKYNKVRFIDWPNDHYLSIEPCENTIDIHCGEDVKEWIPHPIEIIRKKWVLYKE